MSKYIHILHIFKTLAAMLVVVIVTYVFSFVAPTYAQEIDDEEISSSTLDVFGNEHEGVFQLNQENGALSSQLNSLALGFAVDGAAISNTSSSQALADTQESMPGALPIIFASTMQNGLNLSSGLLAVNQSSGIGSIQSNQVAVAISQAEKGFASALSTSFITGLVAPDPMLTIPTNFASSQIRNIGNGTGGLVTINQESGFATVQRNIIAVASAPSGGAYASARAFRGPKSDLVEEGEMSPSNFVAAAGRVSIADSFNGASGLVQVSQASGSFNSQSNVLAVAFGGLAIARAVGDEALGAIHSDPVASQQNEAAAEPGGTELSNSFAGFNGLAQIAQTSGHNNITNNTLSVSISTLPIGGLGG